MNESSLTQDLMAELRGYPDCVVMKHADNFTVGVPDISVTRQRCTRWAEIKHVRERLSELRGERSFKAQMYQMKRLDQMGYALYIVFWGKTRVERTEIWEPVELEKAVFDRPHNGPMHIWSGKGLKSLAELLRGLV